MGSRECTVVAAWYDEGRVRLSEACSGGNGVRRRQVWVEFGSGFSLCADVCGDCRMSSDLVVT